MDPWLENPALWPDVHNRLIVALADFLSPRLAPRYYVGVEGRVYQLEVDELHWVGVPDITVTPREENFQRRRSELPLVEIDVVEVEVPVDTEVQEWFLEIREVGTGEVVTAIELLSPTNKHPGTGRREYEIKRKKVFDSLTNLVEIDLLRGGEPMPLQGRGRRVASDYRILVSRGDQRPRAQLYPFSVRQAIPLFVLPLLPGDQEPQVALNTIFHDLYERAQFGMIARYAQPPAPPLPEADAAWAAELITAARPG